MLFDSFATANEVARNRARMQSSTYKVSGTAEQVALKVVEFYLDVLRLRENVRLTQKTSQSPENLRPDLPAGDKWHRQAVRCRSG